MGEGEARWEGERKGQDEKGRGMGREMTYEEEEGRKDKT